MATQCLLESFKIDRADTTQMQALSIKPVTLHSLFNTYLQARNKMKADKPTSAAAKASATEKAASPPPPQQDREAADKLKAEGNAKLAAGDCHAAIDCYTRAIELSSDNPIYYSNRAAAYSKVGENVQAVADCEAALKIDPNYAKAYSRLGYALRDHICV